MNTPAKGYIVIRNNMLIATTRDIATAIGVAKNLRTQHTTVWSLDTMTCVAEYGRPEPTTSAK